MSDATSPATDEPENGSTGPAAAAESAPAGRGELSPGRRLMRDSVVYTLARIGLFVGLVVVIVGVGKAAGVDVPLTVAGIIALVIALPLSMLLFARLRRNVNAGISAVDAGRRARREELHSKLRDA